MKNRRPLLYLAIMFFAITAASIIMIALEVQKCYAEDIHDIVGLIKNGGQGSYLYMKKDGSAHIYWANYDIAYNHGSIKTKEGTHSKEYIIDMRPQKLDSEGYLTHEYLKWLANLNYTHLTEKDEVLVLLSKSGMDNVRTEKSGRYFFYIWKDDDAHGRYVEWCNSNGVRIKHLK